MARCAESRTRTASARAGRSSNRRHPAGPDRGGRSAAGERGTGDRKYRGSPAEDPLESAAELCVCQGLIARATEVAGRTRRQAPAAALSRRRPASGKTRPDRRSSPTGQRGPAPDGPSRPAAFEGRDFVAALLGAVESDAMRGRRRADSCPEHDLARTTGSSAAAHPRTLPDRPGAYGPRSGDRTQSVQRSLCRLACERTSPQRAAVVLADRRSASGWNDASAVADNFIPCARRARPGCVRLPCSSGGGRQRWRDRTTTPRWGARSCNSLGPRWAPSCHRA